MASSTTPTTTTTNNYPSSSSGFTLELDFPWMVGGPVTTTTNSSTTCPSTLDFSSDLFSMATTTAASAGPMSPVTNASSLQLDLPAFWSPINFTPSPVRSAMTPQLASTPSTASSQGHHFTTSSPVGGNSSSDSSGYSSLLSSVSSTPRGSPSSAASSDASLTASPPQTNVTTAATASPVISKVTTQKTKKPTASYIEMIARALLSNIQTKMILSEIYAYILEKYPYYQSAPDGNWRNAIRHNLCVNDCFVKSGRSKSGRGYYWTIHPACVEMFSRGDFSRMRARRLAQKMYKSLHNAAAASSATSAAPAKVNVSVAPHSVPQHHYQAVVSHPSTMATSAAYPPMTSQVSASPVYHQQQQQGHYNYMRSISVPTQNAAAMMSYYPASGMTSSSAGAQGYSGYSYPSSGALAYHPSHAYQQTPSPAYQTQMPAYNQAYQSQFYLPTTTATTTQRSYHGYGLPTYI